MRLKSVLSLLLVLSLCLCSLRPIYDIEFIQNENIIIGLGFTGSGKSTFLNLLAGYDLTIFRDQASRQLKYKLVGNETDASPIGNNFSSSTVFTKFIRSKDRKDMIAMDLPGLADNRGEIYEVINGFCLRALSQGNNFVKALIVIDQPSLTYGDKLETIFKWLNLPYDQCSLSFGLIITKVSIQSEELKSLLKQRAHDLKKKLVRGAEQFACMVSMGRYRAFYTPEKANQFKIKIDNQRHSFRKHVNQQLTFSRPFKIGPKTPDYTFRQKLKAIQSEVASEMQELTVRFGKKIGWEIKQAKTSSNVYTLLQKFLSVKEMDVFERLNILTEIPAWKNIIMTEIMRFRGLLKYIDTHWAKDLEDKLRWNLAQAINQAVERIKQNGAGGFAGMKKNWWSWLSGS